MKLRTLVLALAALGIPLALLVLVLPITWGYGGYTFQPVAGFRGGAVKFVDPAGPAFRAGMRFGDELIESPADPFPLNDAGPVGTVVHDRLVRNGKSREVVFAFTAFTGQLGVQQVISKSLGCLTALGAFIIAILIVLRARNVNVGTRSANVLVLAGGLALVRSASLVSGNAWAADVLYRVLPPLLDWGTLWAALSLLAVFPSTPTRFRTLTARLGIIPMAYGCLIAGGFAQMILTGQSGIAAVTVSRAALFMNIILWSMLAASIVNGIATARNEDAAPARWLGGIWLLGVAMLNAPFIAALSGAPVLLGHYGDVLRMGFVFCLALGVAYPVLRHRIVDLNILVSRATVFTLVSLIIVGAFVGAEWAIGRIFERSFGLSSERGGVIPELVTLCVVLILGISARSIHKFVEERLTQMFFRKRLQGLAEIERVAQESDAATDAGAVMTLAVAAVQRTLKPLGAAFYLRKGDAYELACAAGTIAFTPAYDFNDAAPLRLRRWQKPFEIDDESDDRHHMLYLPMTVRSELLGFLCCGPKPDRTLYQPDEIAALSLLAHHAGIASAWLKSGASMPPLSFVHS